MSELIIKCQSTKIGKYRIIIDDTHIGDITNDEVKSFEIDKGKHTLVFKSLGEKTKGYSFELDSNPLGIMLKANGFSSKIEQFNLPDDYKLSIKNCAVEKVKVLGIRSGEETKSIATWNTTIYALLVVYVTGARDVIECTADSKQFRELINYIEV